MKRAILVLMMAALLGATASAGESREVMAAFIKALKEGKSTEAAAKVFTPQGREQSMKERVDSLIGKFRTADADTFEIAEAKEAKTVAIVIVKDAVKAQDGRPDYDAITLLKRQGNWKVVLGNAEVERLLSPEEKAELTELQQWQDEAMKKLKGLPNGK